VAWLAATAPASRASTMPARPLPAASRSGWSRRSRGASEGVLHVGVGPQQRMGKPGGVQVGLALPELNAGACRAGGAAGSGGAAELAAGGGDDWRAQRAGLGVFGEGEDVPGGVGAAAGDSPDRGMGGTPPSRTPCPRAYPAGDRRRGMGGWHGQRSRERAWNCRMPTRMRAGSGWSRGISPVAWHGRWQGPMKTVRPMRGAPARSRQSGASPAGAGERGGAVAGDPGTRHSGSPGRSGCHR